MELHAKTVAVILSVICINQCTLAKSFGGLLDDSPADFQQRQLLGNLLPPWLDRIRNRLPSVLTGRTTKFPSTANKKPIEVLNWPSIDLDVGQITGVAVDEKSNPVIFHRGHVKWTGSSFEGNRYTNANEGPIQNDTIVTLDAATGALLDHWGANLFYMPHGLEVDAEGNVWVTDVALHQVFKFPKGSRTPSLTMGEAFVSGSDEKHFCKPTDVAVASSGVFFVADGYCNKRIQKFDPSGKLIGTYHGSFNVPHSLALFEERDELCIADRDNSRLSCIPAGLQNDGPRFGTDFKRSAEKKIGQVYAIAAKGNDAYAIIGSIFVGLATGKTINLDSMETEETWTPSRGFRSPHDLAISRDGESMYVVEIGPNRITKFALE